MNKDNKKRNQSLDSIKAWSEWLLSGSAKDQILLTYIALVRLNIPSTFYQVTDYLEEVRGKKNESEKIPVTHMGSNIGRHLFNEGKAFKLKAKGKTPKNKACQVWVSDVYYRNNPEIELCPVKHPFKSGVQANLFKDTQILRR